ncbi:hypothetical protein BDZ45DRAFT_762240 [Acephala macrosclerotiorum]|nr:hypothetical protein BDZ45DRAFT_762240 [Acephala macrosclerotiorum]
MTPTSCQCAFYRMRIHLSQSTRRAHKCFLLPRYTSFSLPASTSTTIRCSSSSTFASHSRVVLPLIRTAKSTTISAPTQLRMSTMPIMLTNDKPAECTLEMKLIEESLSDYSLKPGSPWGFVVYRVVYGDGTDAKWSRMLRILAENVEDDLISQERMETLGPRHQLLPMDDRERFEGMTTHDVRKHFRSWVVDELEVWLADRPSLEEMNEMRTGKKSATKTPVDILLGTRYNICVYVDESCLDSLDHEFSPGPIIKLSLTVHFSSLQLLFVLCK